MASVAVFLAVSSVTASPPANDDCENALEMSPGIRYYGAIYEATPDGGASCAKMNSTADVWHRYDAAEAVNLTISTCDRASFDTVISVHRSCPGDTENETDCNDDACGTSSRVETSVAAGETLWVRVASSDGAVGDYDLLLHLGPSPTPLPEAADERGLTIHGANTGDSTANRVATGGDFNGDGFDDIALSAPWFDPGGVVYIIFGGSGLASAFDVTYIDGSNGVVLVGAPLSEAGSSIAWAGDVNGDGFDDLVVGDPELDPFLEDAGGAFLVYGSPMPPAEIELLELDGSDGFALYGRRSRDYAGTAVAEGGDVNGDGFDDFVVSAPDAPFQFGYGEVYLVYGSPTMPDTLDLDLLDGSNGIRIDGNFDNSGATGDDMAAAGDMNGDGYDDLLIGAPTDNVSFGFGDGAVYLVYGAPDLPHPLRVAQLDEMTGVVIEGTAHRDGYAGSSVDGAGDVNGDGYLDLVLSAPMANAGGRPQAGEVYIVYGGAALPERIELGLLDVESGVVLEGPTNYENAGHRVAGGGDWNGDGLDDVVIGVPESGLRSLEDSGYVYVVYGSTELPARALLPNLIPEGGTRYIGDEDDEAGTDVSIVGDINGDGISDLVVGAPEARTPTGTRAGEAYVIYGDTRGEYLAGDWDGDGRDNFAVRLDGTIYMDYDFDERIDQVQEFGDGDLEDEYLVGDWDGDGRDNLAIRDGDILRMDTDFDSVPDLEVRYGAGASEDQYLIADFNGDGRDDIAVRRGNRILVELWPWEDGAHDAETTYGGGESEDQYLAGNWTNDGRANQTLAVRRGIELWINKTFDGTHDAILTYGPGDSPNDYLVGDWDGDGIDDIAVRRGYDLLMNLDRDGAPEQVQRLGPGLR